MTKIKTAPTGRRRNLYRGSGGRVPGQSGEKNAAKHMVARQAGDEGACQEIQANVRTVPGIITQRGCCYAGCKGVVIGPIGDMVHITHGPIGCGFLFLADPAQFLSPQGRRPGFSVLLLFHGHAG